MPGMSGLELQSQHGDNGARAPAIQAGAVAFFAKPFDHQELLDAIDSALGRS